MGKAFRVFKRFFFWSYGRSTWQYDVLCVAILAFIFLTPKGWFNNSELASSGEHHTQFAATVWLLKAEDFAANPDPKEVERRVRELTKRTDVRVKKAHPVEDAAGQIIAYEVDIE